MNNGSTRHTELWEDISGGELVSTFQNTPTEAALTLQPSYKSIKDRMVKYKV